MVVIELLVIVIICVLLVRILGWLIGDMFDDSDS